MSLVEHFRSSKKGTGDTTDEYIKRARAFDTDRSILVEGELKRMRIIALVAVFAALVAVITAGVVVGTKPPPEVRVLYIDNVAGMVGPLVRVQGDSLTMSQTLRESFIQQFITCYEGYEPGATFEMERKKCMLFVKPNARGALREYFGQQMERYGAKGSVKIEFKGFTPLNDNDHAVLVRFVRTGTLPSGETEPPHGYAVRVISDANPDVVMSEENWRLNPIGFQVAGYEKRDDVSITERKQEVQP